jgi:hypothetical protein
MTRILAIALIALSAATAAQAQNRMLPAGSGAGLKAAENQMGAPVIVSPLPLLQEGRSDVVVKTNRVHHRTHQN